MGKDSTTAAISGFIGNEKKKIQEYAKLHRMSFSAFLIQSALLRIEYEESNKRNLNAKIKGRDS
jgi:hypothetical protein